MDLIALATADPTVLPLWGVLLLALGMYPFGMMFGCTPCCSVCSECEEGTLPETVTVTLDGFTDKTQGPWLCNLTFDACYGSGAAGRVASPGGDPATDAGPITAVALTNGGSGYARLGRASPTVTAEGSGSGATFTVTLEATQDDCDLDFWKVKSVTGSGGAGYYEDEQLQFTVAAGDTAEHHAVARVKTIREEPEITLTVDSVSGTGASLTAAFEEIPGTPVTWRLASVTVDDGGDLYVRGDTVTIGLVSGTLELLPATLQLKAAHAEPTVSASTPYGSGTGAVLSATLAPATGYDGSPVWEVASIAVSSPGVGYQQYDTVEVAVVDGSQDSTPCWAWVADVDEDGGIVSVTVWGGGEYYKGGPISEIAVPGGGQYFKDSGIVASVVVVHGGVYYREDASLPPHVADVAVTIIQLPPSAGAGAEISATVGDDPEDAATFGKITALAIDAAGDDYLAWRWLANNCCGHNLNGKQYVLRRQSAAQPGSDPGQTGQQYTLVGGLAGVFVPHNCVYAHTICGGWQQPFLSYGLFNFPRLQYAWHTIMVGYRGPTLPPVAGISRASLFLDGWGGSACEGFYVSDSLVTDCSAFEFDALYAGSQSTGGQHPGSTISVSPGGDYDAEDTNPGGQGAGCSACCQGAGSPPQEITVQVQDLRPFAPVNITGQHVLTKWNGNYQRWDLVIPGAGDFGNAAQISVSMDASFCARQPDDGGCDHCIKKCAVFGGVYFGTLGGWDTRTCSDSEAQECAAMCLDTPLCAPPAGVEIPWSLQGLCADPDFIITT